MTDRRVRFTETAEDHVEREHAWWRDNRDYSELFRSELDLGIQLVAVLTCRVRVLNTHVPVLRVFGVSTFPR